MRMRGAQWQQEQQTRLAMMGASLTAKLHRLPAREFRSAIRNIQAALKPRPERQDPETQRALLLDWAAQMGLKVEHHERPVI